MLPLRSGGATIAEQDARQIQEARRWADCTELAQEMFGCGAQRR